jgi:hypothetical protein
MPAAAPIFAAERTAAKLLDMRPAEFREHVDAGRLPRPCDIGGAERWDVEALARIIRGEAAEGPTTWRL